MTTDQLHGPLSTGADSPSNPQLMDQTSSQHPLDLDIPDGENSPPRGWGFTLIPLKQTF